MEVYYLSSQGDSDMQPGLRTFSAARSMSAVTGSLNSHALGKQFPWFPLTNPNALLAVEQGSSSSPISIAAAHVSFTVLSGVTRKDLGHRKWQQLPSVGKYTSSFLPAMSHGHGSNMTHQDQPSTQVCFSTLTEGSCCVSQ